MATETTDAPQRKANEQAPETQRSDNSAVAAQRINHAAYTESPSSANATSKDVSKKTDETIAADGKKVASADGKNADVNGKDGQGSPESQSKTTAEKFLERLGQMRDFGVKAAAHYLVNGTRFAAFRKHSDAATANAGDEAQPGASSPGMEKQAARLNFTPGSDEQKVDDTKVAESGQRPTRQIDSTLGSERAPDALEKRQAELRAVITNDKLDSPTRLAAAASFAQSYGADGHADIRNVGRGNDSYHVQVISAEDGPEKHIRITKNGQPDISGSTKEQRSETASTEYTSDSPMMRDRRIRVADTRPNAGFAELARLHSKDDLNNENVLAAKLAARYEREHADIPSTIAQAADTSKRAPAPEPVHSEDGPKSETSDVPSMRQYLRRTYQRAQAETLADMRDAQKAEIAAGPKVSDQTREQSAPQTKEARAARNLDVIKSPDSTPAEKMDAIKDFVAENGVRGKAKNVEIEGKKFDMSVDNIGKNGDQLIHLWDRTNGRQQIGLKGVYRNTKGGDGETRSHGGKGFYERQYQSDWTGKNFGRNGGDIAEFGDGYSVSEAPEAPQTAPRTPAVEQQTLAPRTPAAEQPNLASRTPAAEQPSVSPRTPAPEVQQVLPSPAKPLTPSEIQTVAPPAPVASDFQPPGVPLVRPTEGNIPYSSQFPTVKEVPAGQSPAVVARDAAETTKQPVGEATRHTERGSVPATDAVDKATRPGRDFAADQKYGKPKPEEIEKRFGEGPASSVRATTYVPPGEGGKWDNGGAGRVSKGVAVVGREVYNQQRYEKGEAPYASIAAGKEMGLKDGQLVYAFDKTKGEDHGRYYRVVDTGSAVKGNHIDIANDKNLDPVKMTVWAVKESDADRYAALAKAAVKNPKSEPNPYIELAKTSQKSSEAEPVSKQTQKAAELTPARQAQPVEITVPNQTYAKPAEKHVEAIGGATPWPEGKPFPKRMEPVTDPVILNDLGKSGNKVEPYYLGVTDKISVAGPKGEKVWKNDQPLWADKTMVMAVDIAEKRAQARSGDPNLKIEFQHDAGNPAGRTVWQGLKATGLTAKERSLHVQGARSADIANWTNPYIKEALDFVGIKREGAPKLADPNHHILKSSEQQIAKLWDSAGTMVADIEAAKTKTPAVAALVPKQTEKTKVHVPPNTGDLPSHRIGTGLSSLIPKDVRKQMHDERVQQTRLPKIESTPIPDQRPVTANPMDTATSNDEKVHKIRISDNSLTAAPEAIVRIPENFDSSKNFRVELFFHGNGASVQSVEKQFKPGDKAPSDVVSINVERSAGQMTAKALQKIFEKTPELKGKTIDNVSGIGITGHSNGYLDISNMLTRDPKKPNPVLDKIDSVTNLDGNYDTFATAIKPWVLENRTGLADGSKRLIDVCNATCGGAAALDKLLKTEGITPKSALIDLNRGTTPLTTSYFKDNNVVIARNKATDNGLGPHGILPRHFNQIIASRPGPAKQQEQIQTEVAQQTQQQVIEKRIAEKVPAAPTETTKRVEPTQGNKKRVVAAPAAKDNVLTADQLKLDPALAVSFDTQFRKQAEDIRTGALKPNAKGIVPIHANGGEVWDESKLKWAIDRPAEGRVPDVSSNKMPFTGLSTISSAEYNRVMKENNSLFANHREEVTVKRADGTLTKVSLDMGQLAKLYEVKWQEQGNMSINAAAQLAQSYHEIQLANPKALANISNGALERTKETNQLAGIKVGKGTFRCEATDTKWESVATKDWSKKLSGDVWADKKETRVWGTPGKALCGWFEHIGEKYVANGRTTAEQIIPQYVGAGGGPKYTEGFAKGLREFSQASTQPVVQLADVAPAAPPVSAAKATEVEKTVVEPSRVPQPEIAAGDRSKPADRLTGSVKADDAGVQPPKVLPTPIQQPSKTTGSVTGRDSAVPETALKLEPKSKDTIPHVQERGLVTEARIAETLARRAQSRELVEKSTVPESKKDRKGNELPKTFEQMATRILPGDATAKERKAFGGALEAQYRKEHQIEASQKQVFPTAGEKLLGGTIIKPEDKTSLILSQMTEKERSSLSARLEKRVQTDAEIRKSISDLSKIQENEKPADVAVRLIPGNGKAALAARQDLSEAFAKESANLKSGDSAIPVAGWDRIKGLLKPETVAKIENTVREKITAEASSQKLFSDPLMRRAFESAFPNADQTAQMDKLTATVNNSKLAPAERAQAQQTLDGMLSSQKIAQTRLRHTTSAYLKNKFGDLKNQVIIIDAGHGPGESGDPGTTSNGVKESIVVGNVAKNTTAQLKALGFTVVNTDAVTMEDGRSLRSLPASARAQWLSTHFPDSAVRISLHCDEAGSQDKPPTSYVAKRDKASTSLGGHTANFVDRGLHLTEKHGAVKDQSETRFPTLGMVSTPGAKAAILFEIGNLSNDKFRTAIQNPRMVNSYSAGIAYGIASYLKWGAPARDTKPAN